MQIACRKDPEAHASMVVIAGYDFLLPGLEFYQKTI
jgi:hypothetical protein